MRWCDTVAAAVLVLCALCGCPLAFSGLVYIVSCPFWYANPLAEVFHLKTISEAFAFSALGDGRCTACLALPCVFFSIAGCSGCWGFVKIRAGWVSSNSAPSAGTLVVEEQILGLGELPLN